MTANQWGLCFLLEARQRFYLPLGFFSSNESKPTQGTAKPPPILTQRKITSVKALCWMPTPGDRSGPWPLSLARAILTRDGGAATSCRPCGRTSTLFTELPSVEVG